MEIDQCKNGKLVHDVNLGSMKGQLLDNDVSNYNLKRHVSKNIYGGSVRRPLFRTAIYDKHFENINYGEVNHRSHQKRRFSKGAYNDSLGQMALEIKASSV